ncbi:MAG: transcriptional regulator [Chloroflexi bacterium]|nr:transcriptional regulator [Chloroflexota bacterium]MYD47844.1 transcriptional regulator [Chloroflexota bacterium]
MKANTNTMSTVSYNTEPSVHTSGDVNASHVNYTGEAATGRAESHLSVAARERGLNIKELAALMGIGPSHLSQVARGKKTLTPYMSAKIEAVLGWVPPQGVVHRQGGVLHGGESTYLRERAREQGMTLRQVADRAGLTYGYVVQVSRGHRNLSPAAQARMESVLEAPVKIEAAQCPATDPNALWERMDAHGWSQNETARRAGISIGMLSQVMNGKPTPSGDLLRRLHGVLFAPSAAELVAPVELKVIAWKKGGRNGVVIKGAGGPRNGGKPGDGTIRVGGRVPWGAEVQFAYTTGYDSHGRVSVNHVVDGRGCSALLKRCEPAGI